MLWYVEYLWLFSELYSVIYSPAPLPLFVIPPVYDEDLCVFIYPAFCLFLSVSLRGDETEETPCDSVLSKVCVSVCVCGYTQHTSHSLLYVAPCGGIRVVLTVSGSREK